MGIPSAGFALGALVTNGVSGFICHHWDWSWVFITAGAVGVVYLLVLVVLFRSDPYSCSWIGYDELIFITGLHTINLVIIDFSEIPNTMGGYLDTKNL